MEDQPSRSPDWLVASATRFHLLSQAQRIVLSCLARGMDIRATAHALGRSERTVKMHTTAIMTKLGVDSRLKAGLVGYHLAARGELEVPETTMPKRPYSAG